MPDVIRQSFKTGWLAIGYGPFGFIHHLECQIRSKEAHLQRNCLDARYFTYDVDSWKMRILQSFCTFKAISGKLLAKGSCRWYCQLRTIRSITSYENLKVTAVGYLQGALDVFFDFSCSCSSKSYGGHIPKGGLLQVFPLLSVTFGSYDMCFSNLSK